MTGEESKDETAHYEHHPGVLAVPGAQVGLGIEVSHHPVEPTEHLVLRSQTVEEENEGHEDGIEDHAAGYGAR